jgi:hypothetical protein
MSIPVNKSFGAGLYTAAGSFCRSVIFLQELKEHPNRRRMRVDLKYFIFKNFD